MCWVDVTISESCVTFISVHCTVVTEWWVGALTVLVSRLLAVVGDRMLRCRLLID